MTDPAPMYAPAPAPMYAPGPGVVVVAAAPAPAPTVPLGSTVRYREIPVQIQCQFCNNVTTTNTMYENGLICFFGGGCGCCLIPLCINDCKDVTHLCGNCHKMVGKYQRLS